MKIPGLVLLVALTLISCRKESDPDEIYTFPARHPTYEKVPGEGAMAVWFRNGREGVALRSAQGSGSSFTRIAKTADGGNSWSTVLDVLDQDPREMEFVPNSPVGYFTTWRSLYRSDDYGNSWTKLYETADAFTYVFELCVIGENTLLLVFDGKINKSTDGGKSWQPIKQLDQTGTKSVSTILFINENQGFIGYRDGTVERSTDGGQSWQNSDTGFQDQISSFFFRDGQHGYASCYYRDYIAVTENGGQSWTKSRSTDRLSGFMQMWFNGDGAGLLTARSNKMFYSDDNGKTTYLFLNAPGLGDDPGFIQVAADKTIWAGFPNSLYKITLKP